MKNSILEVDLDAMVAFTINFAHENYLKTNAVEGGNIAGAIPYLKEQGFPQVNIYDTPEIRRVVGKILVKSSSSAEPYYNSKYAGQIILAGSLGSAAKLREKLESGEFPERGVQDKYDAAKVHSVKSDFDIFKAGLSDNRVHGYSLATHDETFSRISGLYSGIDNAIQHFAAQLGYGAIIDNTLAPVTAQQEQEFEKAFAKTCKATNVTVIGLALTPEEAVALSGDGADTAIAFAEQASFIQEHAHSFILMNGHQEIIYSHEDSGRGEVTVNVEEVVRWKKANGVEASRGNSTNKPTIPDFDEESRSTPPHMLGGRTPGFF